MGPFISNKALSLSNSACNSASVGMTAWYLLANSWALPASSEYLATAALRSEQRISPSVVQTESLAPPFDQRRASDEAVSRLKLVNVIHLKPAGHQRRNVIVAITTGCIEKKWRCVQLIGVHVCGNATVFRAEKYPGGQFFGCRANARF